MQVVIGSIMLYISFYSHELLENVRTPEAFVMYIS